MDTIDDYIANLISCYYIYIIIARFIKRSNLLFKAPVGGFAGKLNNRNSKRLTFNYND